MSPPDAALQWARILSSAINPLFVVLWLIALWVAWRRKDTRLGPYCLASLAGLLVSYLVVHGFRWLGLWTEYPEFPSGHEAFAASIGTSLVILDARLLAVTLPLLGILGVALVRAHYHVPLDIAGALIVSPILTWLCHFLVVKKTRTTSA
ncbi:MAG TPA: phosphatase PAP2 family protein [Capsulimonadaceae bacterium]|nr:phosphatase PAP2 family protein [Capsulimonadaceae bacterium]